MSKAVGQSACFNTQKVTSDPCPSAAGRTHYCIEKPEKKMVVDDVMLLYRLNYSPPERDYEQIISNLLYSYIACSSRCLVSDMRMFLVFQNDMPRTFWICNEEKLDTRFVILVWINMGALASDIKAHAEKFYIFAFECWLYLKNRATLATYSLMWVEEGNAGL